MNTCRHHSTARSAKNRAVWVCLTCGEHVYTEVQRVLQVERVQGRETNYVHELEDEVPMPPKREVP